MMKIKAPRQLVLAALCCALLQQGGDALPPGVGGLGWAPRAMPGEGAFAVLVLRGRETRPPGALVFMCACERAWRNAAEG